MSDEDAEQANPTPAIQTPDAWRDWPVDVKGVHAEVVRGLDCGSYAVVILTGEEGGSKGVFVPVVTSEGGALVPLSRLLDGDVIGIAGSSEFLDWQLVRDFVRAAPFGCSLVAGTYNQAGREAVMAAAEFGVKAEVIEEDESLEGISRAVVGLQIAEDSTDVVVFWDGSSEGTRNIAQVARGKNKLRLVIPPRAYWQEFIAKRGAMEEREPWLDDSNLPGPPTGEFNDSKD